MPRLGSRVRVSFSAQVHIGRVLCPGGGIGRRARFRCVCREACRFDSCPGHSVQQCSMERWRNGRRAALRWQCREAWEFESPPLHSIVCGNSSAGRAQPCQGWGREFESRFPLRCISTARFVKKVMGVVAHATGGCDALRAD